MKKTYTLIITALIIFSNAWTQTPNFTWANQIGGANSDVGRVIKMDNHGNIINIGSFSGTVDFDPGPGVFNLIGSGIYVSKFNSLGNFIWAKNFGAGASPYAACLDNNNNIYVTGIFINTVDFDPGPGVFNLVENGSGPGDNFICKLDSSGNLLWAKRIGGPSNEFSFSIAIDAGGNVYTVGTFTGTVDFDPGPGTFNLVGSGCFVSKLDMNGNFVWAKKISGAFSTQAIAINSAGDLFINGRFMNTGDFDPGPGIFNMTSAGNEDAFLLKLDSLGSFIWAKQWGGTDFDRATTIALDINNNIYSAGIFNGTVDFDPGPGVTNLTTSVGGYIFINKLDSNGNFIWARTLGGTNNTDLKIDNSNNVYSTATFGGTADFDPGVGIFNLTSIGPNDCAISKLDSSGNFMYAGQIDADVIHSFTLNPANDLYITGAFRNTVDFDLSAGIFNMTSFSAGIADIFIAKYATCAIAPSQPGSISGTTTICSGSSNTYSIIAVPGAASYTWTLPGGWSGTSTTNSINTTASAISGNITVTSNNACGNSSPQTLTITVNAVPAIPGTISGSTSICSGSSNTYSITDVPGATSYTWTLPSGWSGTSITNSINTTASATSGNISVTANNSCGSSTTQVLAINVNTTPSIPGTISGLSTICTGSSNTYSIATAPGATSYTWTLPGGWSGTSTTNSINTTASATGGNITVTADNACGSSTPQTLAITVNTAPSIPGTIAGSANICEGSTNTYSIVAVPGATSYTWTLPSGWSGTSTTNSINTTASTTSGNITVTANNTCGSSTAQTLAITVNTTPATPGTIAGSTIICEGSANTYSIASIPGATSYTWTLPSGWSGTSTTNSINTTASATGGNITVTADNACGSSTPQTLAITVNTVPASPGTISGLTSICSGSANTYSIISVLGATSYTWTLPGGWTGTSTTNSINTTASATSGNITVTANNDCGNSSSQTLTITVNPLPMVNFNHSDKDTVCINAGLQTLSGGTPAGGNYSGPGVTGVNFDPNAAGLGTHAITYSFTDGNSCTNTATINITVIGCSGIEANSSSSIVVYPNPFTNSITLNGIESVTEIKLYNALGEVSGTWIISETDHLINTENLRPGIYFLSINGIATYKIIKQ